LDLVKDRTVPPIAVIIAGPSGAGKSYSYKKLLPAEFVKRAVYLNVDSYVEYWQKNSLDADKAAWIASYEASGQADASADAATEAIERKAYNSLRGTYLSTGTACNDEDLQNAIAQSQSLIIDRPSGNIGTLQALLDQLDGYHVIFLLVYASLPTVIDQNSRRARRVPLRDVVNIWKDIVKNMPIYQETFKSNMVLVDNTNVKAPGVKLDDIRFYNPELADEIEGILKAGMPAFSKVQPMPQAEATIAGLFKGFAEATSSPLRIRFDPAHLPKKPVRGSRTSRTVQAAAPSQASPSSSALSIQTTAAKPAKKPAAKRATRSRAKSSTSPSASTSSPVRPLADDASTADSAQPRTRAPRRRAATAAALPTAASASNS